MSIWVGRYAIVDGAVREHGPAFVDRIRTREDETVRLLVLAEPADTRSAEFCPEVADAVAELFARESLSVTGGLLRALRQAHSNLAEWNRRSLREHAVSVGLTCVAIREGEVTVAQVGPGAAYTWGPEGFQRFVASEGDGAAPIGGPEAIAPQFHQLRIDGRLLLLLTSGVERVVGQSAIATAMAAGPERALADLFMRTRSIPDMTAALVADLDVPEEVLAAAQAESGGPAPAQPWREPWEAAPAQRAVDSGSDFLAATRRRFALPSLKREHGPYGAAGTGPGALSRVGARRGGTISSSGGVAEYARWRALAMVGMALLTIGLLAWCTLPGFLTQDRTSQLNDALAAAQTHIAAAQQAAEVGQARTELDAARTEVARARGLQPSEPRVAELQGTVDKIAASLDATVDLGDGLKRVIAFDGSVTAPFNMTSVVFGDGALWTIDGQRGRVFRIDPTGKTDPQEVYRAGGTYGATTGKDPRAITWDTAAQRLLLIDAGPTLFVIAPGKPPAPVPMRGAKDLKSIAAIATYSGNLYVLDPLGGEVWRYLPGGDGFDSERAAVLGGVDLGDARAFAVDGDLYILGSASARHFRPPKELAPLLQGIDHPIASAAGLSGDAQRQLIYVADRGGRRVAVSDREGAYRRQYRHPQFADIRGIALSADGATAYVLTGEGIYSFTPSP
jgi:hypothetical protein